MDDVPRHMKTLTRAEAMRRVASAKIGRVVFTERALPAVRVVSHVVHDGHIVVRSTAGAAIITAADTYGTVVAYQADEIDGASHLGWSVTVTGMARLVEDPQQIARYRELLPPWDEIGADQVIRIEPELVTGFELGREPCPPSGHDHADP